MPTVTFKATEGEMRFLQWLATHEDYRSQSGAIRKALQALAENIEGLPDPIRFAVADSYLSKRDGPAMHAKRRKEWQEARDLWTERQAELAAQERTAQDLAAFQAKETAAAGSSTSSPATAAAGSSTSSPASNGTGDPADLAKRVHKRLKKVAEDLAGRKPARSSPATTSKGKRKGGKP
jgi:hypothetical protein